MATTLKPSNILHLCDDIQEKIGKEIKCIRIQKDAKKRYNYTTKFISYYIACGNGKASKISGYLNCCIAHNIERMIGNSYRSLKKMSLTRIDANIMADLWQTFHTTNNEMIKYYLNYNTEQSKLLIKEVIGDCDYTDAIPYVDSEEEEEINYGDDSEFPYHVHDRGDSSDSSDSEGSDSSDSEDSDSSDDDSEDEVVQIYSDDSDSSDSSDDED
jgi:hypothetical protein